MPSKRMMDLYDAHLRELPLAERAQLLALLAQDVASQLVDVPEPPLHDLAELEGLGREIWEGIDPDRYVRELRDEWKSRP